jgi:hypothetical protein
MGCVLTKTVLSFVSPFVSPGWVKMCRFVITREEPNNNSTRWIRAVCAQLSASADLCKSGALPFRKPLFYPLNYGDDDLQRINGLNGDEQDTVAVPSDFPRAGFALDRGQSN